MNRELPLSQMLSRRRLLLSLAAVPAIGAIVAACGDDRLVGEPSTSEPQGSTPPTTAAPTPTTPATTPTTDGGFTVAPGADDVILRIDSGVGGFTRPQFAFGMMPQLLVTGDGTVYMPGAQIEIFPPPLLPALAVSKIDQDGLQTLLQAADKAGLLGDIPDYEEGTPPVADVGSTNVTINVNGKEYLHSAFALGMVDPVAGAPTKARANLQSFVETVTNLTGLLGDKVTDVGGVELVKQFAIASVEANPADFGEEPKPTVSDWPVDIELDLSSVMLGGGAKSCVLIDAATIFPLLAKSNELSFFTQNGKTYQLLVRAQIPGSLGC